MNIHFFLRHLFWFVFCANVTQLSANRLSAPLRISTRHFAPYMYQNSSGNFYKGMEFQFLEKMAETFNVSLHFRATSNHSDICFDVAMNVSDICIGGIFPTEDILRHALMSVTYASDDLTWCVHKAGMMPLYFAQLHFMQPMPWFMVIFGYGYVSGFLIYLLVQFDLKYKRRNYCNWHETTFLVTLPAVIGQSPNFQPLKGTVRIFFALILITAFFLFQLIFTNLYFFLHIQKPWHQVSSIDEIMAEDFHLIGTREAFNFLNRNEMIPTNKIEPFYVCEDITECLAYAPTLKNIAIGGSRQNVINSLPTLSSQMFCLDGFENIASYPIALYMRRDFPLKEEVNEFLQQLLEEGFFVKRLSDSQLERKRETPYTESVSLEITNISAALVFIMGCGSVISSSVFVVENFVYRKRKQQRGNGHNIWIYLEQFFDGRRNYFKNVPERLEKQNKNYEEHFPYLD